MHQETRERRCQDTLAFLLDFKGGKATIPGDGNQKVVFTHTRDIAKYVVASLTLEHWEPDSRIAGNRLSYLEVVKLAEEVMSKKLEITYSCQADSECSGRRGGFYDAFLS
jgi:nucleoside-diphosphate-sugar epimerase